MRITGTMINEYFYCKRKLWITYNGINIENELMKIGKILHEDKEHSDSFVLFDRIKLDDFNDEYIIEYKKTSSGKKSAEYQLYYYLYLLKQAGINKKGKLIFLEDKEEEVLVLNNKIEDEIERILKDIQFISSSLEPPEKAKKRYCKNCTFEEYCEV